MWNSKYCSYDIASWCKYCPSSSFLGWVRCLFLCFEKGRAVIPTQESLKHHSNKTLGKQWKRCIQPLIWEVPAMANGHLSFSNARWSAALARLTPQLALPGRPSKGSRGLTHLWPQSTRTHGHGSGFAIFWLWPSRRCQAFLLGFLFL